MRTPSQSAKNIFQGVAYVTAVVAPLLLLMDPSASFPEDWSHHLWMIGYYGEYFRQHGDMPVVMNIASVVGVAQPVFYGYLLYPLLAPLSAILGAAWALRIGVALITTVQFCAVLTAGRNIFRNAALNYTVAASVVWATYSLTNLYNRGAIAEYFATASLVTAVAFAAAMATETSSARRYFFGWLAGCFLVLTVGAHPPTAVLTSAFMVLVGLCAAPGVFTGQLKVTRRTAALLGAAAGLGAIILAPWVYACHLFSDKLSVAQISRTFFFCFERCDSLWGRFAPFPYDLQSTESGITDFGTAYLEAPINVVLLAIAVWNLELLRRARKQIPSAAGLRFSVIETLLALALAWFLFLAALSVSPSVADNFRFFAPYVQYAYRLVSHCNVALLVAVFTSGVLVAKGGGYHRFRHETNVVIAACLATAVLGLLIKLQHAGVVTRQHDTPEFAFGNDHRAKLISQRHAQLVEAYDVPTFAPSLDKTEADHALTIALPVGMAGAAFGKVGSAKIELKKPGWVGTNVAVFPWTKLLVNGEELPAVQTARKDRFFALHLPQGTHDIQAVFQPDRWWVLLHRLSQITVMIVLAISTAWAVLHLFFRPRPAPRSHPTR